MFDVEITPVTRAVNEFVGLTLPGPYYAVVSFALLSTVSVVLLFFRGALVERVTDRATGGSVFAVVYGVIPFGMTALLGGYALSQAARAGVGGVVFRSLIGAAVGGTLVTFAGLGYLVVGGVVTEIERARRPAGGAVIGAGLSAVPWLVFPVKLALLVWMAVAAVGLGGATKAWVHGERTVAAERAR